MGRIRTVRPEFWTTEPVVECSPIARLLLIGLWNFCDDGGRHPASLKTLKMEVFPGDSFTISEMGAWIDELQHNDLLYLYEVDGKPYWQVTNWSEQRIDRPTMRHPAPPSGVGESLPDVEQSDSNPESTQPAVTTADTVYAWAKNNSPEIRRMASDANFLSMDAIPNEVRAFCAHYYANEAYMRNPERFFRERFTAWLTIASSRQKPATKGRAGPKQAYTPQDVQQRFKSQFGETLSNLVNPSMFLRVAANAANETALAYALENIYNNMKTTQPRHSQPEPIGQILN